MQSGLIAEGFNCWQDINTHIPTDRFVEPIKTTSLCGFLISEELKPLSNHHRKRSFSLKDATLLPTCLFSGSYHSDPAEIVRS
jgi:hypothetical protein